MTTGSPYLERRVMFRRKHPRQPHTLNTTVVHSGEVVNTTRHIHDYPNVISIRIWLKFPDGTPMIINGTRMGEERRISVHEPLPYSAPVSGALYLDYVELICEEPILGRRQ